MSLDDLVMASFVSSPGVSTLPVVTFSKVRPGLSAEIDAQATIIVLLVAAGVMAAGIMMSRAEKRRSRDAQLARATKD